MQALWMEHSPQVHHFGNERVNLIICCHWHTVWRQIREFLKQFPQGDPVSWKKGWLEKNVMVGPSLLGGRSKDVVQTRLLGWTQSEPESGQKKPKSSWETFFNKKNHDENAKKNFQNDHFGRFDPFFKKIGGGKLLKTGARWLDPPGVGRVPVQKKIPCTSFTTPTYHFFYLINYSSVNTSMGGSGVTGVAARADGRGSWLSHSAILNFPQRDCGLWEENQCVTFKK